MRKRLLFASLAASLTAIVAMPLVVSAVTVASVYDAVPATLPPNMASLGFQATQTSEFGDYIHLGSSERNLNTVTVTMSDWAKNSTYPSMSASGWSHPITLNIYSNHLVNGVPNQVLATQTHTFNIPWRPETSPSCGGDDAWMASDNICYHGFAFNITFDLSSLNVTLPDDVIVGVAYNTQSYGVAPIGSDGPYNSLNVGLEGSATAVGYDNNTDAIFWNTSTAAWYTDGGAGGVGTFREDTNWTPYIVPIQVNASAALVAPPTNKDQCKHNGWKVFNNPSFKNQGKCVEYVEKHKNNHDHHEDKHEKEHKQNRREHHNDR